MKFLRVLLSCIGLYGMGIVLIKVISELRGWDFYGRDLLSVFCVSLSYLIGFLFMTYVVDKVESIRRVKQVGRDDRNDEWGKEFVWFVSGFIVFLQLFIFFVPILFMSIKDFRFTLPFWFLVIYGLVTGCGSMATIAGFFLIQETDIGNAALREFTKMIGVVVGILALVYPVLAALLIHAINLKY